jgi:hypothetical protein
MGFWDRIGDAADKSAMVTNLVQMNESSGMTYLETVVPRIIDEGWLNEFLLDLARLISSSHVSIEDSEKILAFQTRAREIRDRLV